MNARGGSRDRQWVVWALALSVACGAERAYAQTAAQTADESRPGAAPDEAQTLPEGTEQRPLPDYDGREDEPVTVGEVALWIPRVLFFPLYLVSEYMIRWPLGLLVTTAERDRWVVFLYDLFTFGEDRKAGIVPTAYYEFEFESSVGLYFFADDAFTDGNDLRIHAAMWPDEWWKLTIVDRIHDARDTRRFSLRAALLLRPDYRFYGFGPSTPDDAVAFYSSATYEAEVIQEVDLWRASTLKALVGARRRTFDVDSDFGNPSFRDALADAAHPLGVEPPGFGGYTIWHERLELALDTRQPFPEQAGGGRLDGWAEHAIDVDAPGERSWLKLGGAAAGFLDIGGHRVVGLRLEVELSEPLAGEIPFAELPSFGRDPPLEGFPEGRLRGDSALAGTLEYRWPVWVWVDAAIHYAVGNVFGRELEGFDLDLLRSSFGVGLRTARIKRPDHSFHLILAFGTETFEQGHEIDSVRVAAGGTVGF